MRQRGPLVPRGRNGNKLVTDRVTLSAMPYRRETGTVVEILNPAVLVLWCSGFR